MLRDKKILLGVSASIAAYKSAFLVRQLIQAGAEVQVVMTPSALDFITPLTLSTLSKKPVYYDFFDREKNDGTWNNHVDMGFWADMMIIAPASSNTLAKMVSGACDNLLLATYMSAKCPVYFAPAMDLDMYQNQATQSNIEKLIAFGKHFIPSTHGELASGLVGEGRMAEPDAIVSFIQNHLLSNAPLLGKKVLITAGPTHEPIDPVRFIGNRSSGATGIFLAEKAAQLGAEVHLVLGPTPLQVNEKAVYVTRVETAAQMFEASLSIFPVCDIAIMSAAVADYTPEIKALQKIKKAEAQMFIALQPTQDILKSLGAIKKSHQVLIGFALETENLLANAKKKLHAKNANAIVMNSPSANTGFGVATNQVSILFSEGEVIDLPLMHKSLLATEIWNLLLTRYFEK